MRLAGLGPIRSFVGEVAKFMALESLGLDEVPRILPAIFGVRISVGRFVIDILCK